MQQGKHSEEHQKEMLEESTPARFPIVNIEKTYYFTNDEPPPQEGVIIHYFLGGPHGEKYHRFKLLKTLADLHYIFTVAQTPWNSYGISFKTEEYEFATTNLSKETLGELGFTIAKFVESLSAYEDVHIKEISVTPADASYSSAEIKKCVEKILSSPKNTLSRETLMTSYKGFEVFEYYRELFDEDFSQLHYNQRSRAEARSRLFKHAAHTYLPDWETADTSWCNGFVLKQKNDTGAAPSNEIAVN